MLPYLLMVFSVLLIPVIGAKKIQAQGTDLTFSKRKRIIRGCYLIPFFVLLLFSTLRGPFTQDYNQYIYNLEIYGSSPFSIRTFFDARQEPLFIFLYWLCGRIQQKELAFLFVTSFVVIVGYMRRFIKDSEIPWISILCFVLFGGYLTSFNMIRQMVGCGITLFAVDYLYEKKFLKYTLIILLASLIHVSALIMLVGIPLYYYKPRKLKDFGIFTMLGLSLFLLYRPIISVIQRYVFSSYTDFDYQAMAPIAFNKILLVSVIIFFSFILFPPFEKVSNKEMLWYKLSLACAILLIGSLQVKNFERIATYFYPYVCMMFPSIIKSLKGMWKTLLIFIIIILSVLYMVVTIYGTPFYPYYFGAYF